MLANEFSDDQLPAMMHALRQDEQMVRVICQQIGRQTKVESPAHLILWKIRERKHTELLSGEPIRVMRSTAPPAPSQELVDENKARMREWKRIRNGIRRDADLNELYHALMEAHPNTPQTVKREMLAAMDEMNAGRPNAG